MNSEVMIIELLNRFEPESEGLLHEMSKHISNDMLREIAAADYGQDVDKHLVALRQIRDTGTFPPKPNMIWYPMEVLELIRWSRPENPNWKPGRTGDFGHWMRAFSCAAILRATREPWNYGDGLATEETTFHLILSLRALPVDFTQQAVQFLAWLLLNSEPEGKDNQVCAYGIGLLWFALQLVPPAPDETLVSLAQWIVRRAEEFYLKHDCASDSYLRRHGIDNPPPSIWELLGIALFDLNLSERSPELQEWVGLIGQELTG